MIYANVSVKSIARAKKIIVVIIANVFVRMVSIADSSVMVCDSSVMVCDKTINATDRVSTNM